MNSCFLWFCLFIASATSMAQSLDLTKYVQLDPFKMGVHIYTFSDSTSDGFVDWVSPTDVVIKGKPYKQLIRRYSNGNQDTTFYRLTEKGLLTFNKLNKLESVFLPSHIQLNQSWYSADSSWRYTFVQFYSSFTLHQELFNSVVQIQCENLKSVQNKRKSYNLLYAYGIGLIGDLSNKNFRLKRRFYRPELFDMAYYYADTFVEGIENPQKQVVLDPKLNKKWSWLLSLIKEEGMEDITNISIQNGIAINKDCAFQVETGLFNCVYSAGVYIKENGLQFMNYLYWIELTVDPDRPKQAVVNTQILLPEEITDSKWNQHIDWYRNDVAYARYPISKLYGVQTHPPMPFPYQARSLR